MSHQSVVKDVTRAWVSVACVGAWILLLALPNVLAVPVWPWAHTHAVTYRESVWGWLLLDGSLAAAVTSVVVSLLLLALVRRAVVLTAITFPFMVLMPAEAWYVVEYGHASSAHVLGVLAETNIMEASEFVAGSLVMLIMVAAIVVAAVGCTHHVIRRCRFEWTHRSRVLLLVIVAGTAMTVWARTLIAESPFLSANRTASSSRDLRAIDLVGRDDFSVVYPWGVPLRLVEYAMERHSIAVAAERLKDFRFSASPILDDTPRNVVLVIGESLRSDHLGLNGYFRDTTPELARVHELISFTDAVAAGAATRASVPHIVTRLKTGTGATIASFREPSIVSAFREAGYVTWWISNQMSMGEADNAIAMYAAEAATRRFVNPSTFVGHGQYDGVLIDEVRRALAGPSPHRFIVLHMLGSHFNYRNRYPDEFDRFQPSLGRNEPVTPFEFGKREQIRNAYDNSILYTDHVLSEIIDVLANTSGESALLFMSDHGQALFEGFCGQAAHGQLSATNFRVPLLVWLSPLMRDHHPELQQALDANRRRPVTSESIFPTLLDLGGVRLPGGQGASSLGAASFANQTRWVSADGSNWTDFDRELPSRDCAMAMAPKAATTLHPTTH